MRKFIFDLRYPLKEFFFNLRRFDEIINADDEMQINGTDDNDSIHNSGEIVTIIGGKGDDSINNSGSDILFIYNNGDGNDTIGGF